MIMRMLCLKDMFKRVYGLEPGQTQFNTTLAMLPFSLKMIFGLLVDIKLVAKRKYLLTAFGLLSFICQSLIFSSYVNSSDRMFWAFFTLTLAITVLDATIDSMIV